MNTVAWWIVQNAATVAVLVPAVWVLARLRGTRPAEQHLLWLLLLVKLMTPPLVCWPWPADSLRPWRSAGDSTVHPVSRGAHEEPRRAAGSVPRPSALAGTISPKATGDSRALPAGPVASTGGPAPRAADRPRRSEVRAALAPDRNRIVALGVATAWVLGAAGVGLRMGSRIRWQRRILAESIPPSPRLQQLVGDVARRLRMKPVPARVSPAVASPVVSCLGRPVLVWPTALDHPQSLAECEGVMAHELAHVRRRDHWVAWLELAGALVWWWNPIFWLIRRNLGETRELACDAVAMELPSSDPRRYAELLLAMSRWDQQTVSAAMPLGTGMAPRSSFRRRLAMLFHKRASGRVSAAGLAWSLLLALASLPGWAWSQDDPKERREAAPAQPSAGAPSGAAAEPKPASGAAGSPASGAETAAGPKTGDSDSQASETAPAPPTPQQAELMGRVDWFMLHNFRDITARKSIEWGDVEVDQHGNRSIRYKFFATIRDKDVLIMNQVFTFDAEGKSLSVSNVEGYPQKKAVTTPDITTAEGMRALVEDFFAHNYRDITARETIEWGDVVRNPEGTSSIRYKFRARIWDRETQVADRLFTFDASGKFVSVTDVTPPEGVPTALPADGAKEPPTLPGESLGRQTASHLSAAEIAALAAELELAQLDVEEKTIVLEQGKKSHARISELRQNGITSEEPPNLRLLELDLMRAKIRLKLAETRGEAAQQGDAPSSR